MKQLDAIYTFTPDENRYTPNGQSKVTVYQMRQMSAADIEKHELCKYVEMLL